MARRPTGTLTPPDKQLGPTDGSAIVACVFNVLMTYVAMPVVSRLLRNWLTP
ncbi:hypothetical protein [Streptomyces sp. NPDC002540]